MKSIYLFTLVAGLTLSCAQNPVNKLNSSAGQETSSDTIRDGVFIHITESYSNPHRLLMPLKMATIMTEDKDVLIYMDINAVNILVNDAEDISLEGFESAKTYINLLLAKNVSIYACPTCLKVAGFEPGDLAEGIKVAEKDKFFSFTKGRILTLDY